MLDRLAVHLRRTGTRARLTAAIALITLAALGAVYVAVYRGTGADLRKQIDGDLSEDASALARHAGRRQTGGPVNLTRDAQRYINAQPTFGPASGLIVVKAAGAPRLATNEPELLGVGREPGESAGETSIEAGEARQIRAAPIGYSTVEIADVGEVRLLTRPLLEGGREVGRITVGEPLEPVHAAQSGVSRTFLLAGSIALVAALVAGALVAGRTSRPLRRMARIAGDVDAGELSTRMTPAGPVEARQLAEAFNHMLDRLADALVRQRRFVSDASHELRTPLTAIRGQIEILAQSSDASSEEVARTAEIVKREVDRMQRLVDDMLLLAQTDEELAHTPAPVEVGHLLHDSVAGLSAGIDREIRLTPPPPGTVLVDEDRITQVLRNLVQNAIDHTASGGKINLTASAANGLLRISVSDDGPGIPREQQDRIFARFHRADSSRDRRSGGTGLGLAIARAIVEAHGGRIWAQDAAGGGAQISFELPDFRSS